MPTIAMPAHKLTCSTIHHPTTQIELRSGLSIDLHKLTALRQHWKIAKLELFDPVLHDDFCDNSNIDLLVTWQENHG
jgi:hypothetical protein